MSRVLAFLLAAVAVLVAAESAAAHGVLRREGDVIHYTAPDPAFGATLTISSLKAGTVQFHDTTSPGGMDWGPCLPLTEQKTRCPTKGVSRIEVEVYDGDDSVTIDVATPVHVIAGAGNDHVAGGYGPDTIAGGSGNDALSGGLGADSVSGAEGDDSLDVRDGIADTVSCGDGVDSVGADPSDPADLTTAFACETVAVEPPPPDTDAPSIELDVGRRLELDGSRTLVVPAALDEPGTLSVAGRVLVGGREAGSLGGAEGEPDAPGQVWQLRPSLSSKLAGQVRRALRDGRRVIAALEVSGVDGAGNESTVHERVRVAK